MHADSFRDVVQSGREDDVEDDAEPDIEREAD